MADQCALMGAAVDHGVDLAGLVADHDDRNFTDERVLEVPVVGKLHFQRQEVPNRPPEQGVGLFGVNFRARIKLEGNPANTLLGPFDDWFVGAHCRLPAA